MASLFLSYDRDDLDRARSIAQALEKAGHSVWWDRQIKGGAQYSKEIEQALDAADSVVVLWSQKSVDSPWVRDEAAAGRDSARLVPVSIDNVQPPMGFRQYQTIDLTRWKGRSTAKIRPLLDAVSAGVPGTDKASPPRPVSAAPQRPLRLPLTVLFAVVALIAAAAAYVLLTRGGGTPTVAVTPADSSAASQSLARNLLVKLGTLQGSAAQNVRLLDPSTLPGEADLRFAVGGTVQGGKTEADLTLISNREQSILWSKEFNQQEGERSDLEESVAFAAARVLRCAIEEASGDSGRLKPDTRRLYLNACASSAEMGWDTRPLLPMLRQVIQDAPKFRPAWERLLAAEADVMSFLSISDESDTGLRSAIQQDIEAARKIDPDMAEATLAEASLMPPSDFPRIIPLIKRARDQDPDNALVLSSTAQWLQWVGKMNESVAAAERAVNLDPLAPVTRTSLISTLAYAGQIEKARQELAEAQQLWPGTATVKQAEFSLDLRFGDADKAVHSPEGIGFGDLGDVYLKARHDPSDANVAALIGYGKRLGGSALTFVIQALGEVDRPQDFYALASTTPVQRELARVPYILFRPWMASLRRDPRFMQLAARLGLLAYWRDTGEWPDFCLEPGLPYDCKKEAARLLT